jgi:hypothetical protein
MFESQLTGLKCGYMKCIFQMFLVCQMSASDNGDWNGCLLRCVAGWSGKSVLTFQSIFVPPFRE